MSFSKKNSYITARIGVLTMEARKLERNTRAYKNNDELAHGYEIDFDLLGLKKSK